LAAAACAAWAAVGCQRVASPRGVEDARVASSEPDAVDPVTDAPTLSSSANATPAEVDSVDAASPAGSLDALLPAVDPQGRRVVALLPREMGARGVDGLAMVVKDVGSDREIEEYTLRGPNGDGVRVHNGGATAARALLDAGAWARIAPATVTPDSGSPRHRTSDDEPTTANLAQRGDVVLRYREPVIELRVGSRTLLSRSVVGWSAVASGPVCGRPWGSIEQAWIDASRGIAVVRVGYHGPSSDLCWLPDPTIHVVRW
jgi:hypothetical protein